MGDRRVTAALSPSRAADFKQCPLLYRFRVIDRIPSVPSPAATRGTLVHSVLERVFDLPASERTPSATVALLPQAWQDMLREDPEVSVVLDAADHPGVDEATTAWLDSAAALVVRWFELEDPRRLEPAEREMYVECDVEGLTLRGYIDRLDVAPDSGAVRVVDYKTGRSPSERFEAKALFQMKFYALVLWRLTGEIPALLQLVYLGNNEIVRFQPDERDLLGIEANIKALWMAIERAAVTGDWRPSPSRLCDWCDFKGLCPEFGGVPPPLPQDAAARAVDPSVTGALDEATD